MQGLPFCIAQKSICEFTNLCKPVIKPGLANLHMPLVMALMVLHQLQQFFPHMVAIIKVGCGKLVGIILSRCTCNEFILPAGVPTNRINGRNINVITDHVCQWCLLNTKTTMQILLNCLNSSRPMLCIDFSGLNIVIFFPFMIRMELPNRCQCDHVSSNNTDGTLLVAQEITSQLQIVFSAKHHSKSRIWDLGRLCGGGSSSCSIIPPGLQTNLQGFLTSSVKTANSARLFMPCPFWSLVM